MAADLAAVDAPLMTLGRDLGLVPGEGLLCLVNTAEEYSSHDLMRAVRRLRDVARAVRATVWVQCFDTEPQGPIRTLESVVDTIDLGPGLVTSTQQMMDAVLPGRGGNDGARALTRTWQARAQWPAGIVQDRLLVMFDGLDVHPWSQRVDWPEGPRPQVLGLVIQQQADDVTQEQKRVAYARQRCPDARMVTESALAVALEQQVLRQAIQATIGATPVSTISPPRSTPATVLNTGRALGLVPGGSTLCLFATSAAHAYEDLVPSLYRLHALAEGLGATVWVQCFDTQPRGALRPLNDMVARLRTFEQAPDGWSRVHEVLPGQGGDHAANALSKVLRAHPVLPDGQPVERVLVAFDGLDMGPWTQKVDWPDGPRPQLVGLIMAQPHVDAGATLLVTEKQRVRASRQWAEKQGHPEARICGESMITVALEVLALNDAVQDVAPGLALPSPTSPRRRL